MLDDLNSAQRKVVTTRSGPLLVLAGAGTGKTRVVTYRVAELIRHGTAPERILAVTFTNKAAAEMQQRIGELLKRRTVERPEVSTFHSLCVRILRRHATRLGYPRSFAIYDYADQHTVGREVLRELQVSGTQLKTADLLNQISRWKSAATLPSQATRLASSDREHLAAACYRRYQKTLKLRGAMDFDDLLLLTQQVFNKHSDVRHAEAGRFDKLLIDEYQDTNASQYDIIRSLAIEHRNLCAVGDDDQSIYSWRGADVRHILRFQQDWPDATVVRLEKNYRSTHEILEAANRLISFNKQRMGKRLRAARSGGQRPQIRQFRDETTEAKETVADISRQLQLPGNAPRDFVILFRTNGQPRIFEAELRKARLPYVLVGGTSFYDRKEVRDILAYLRVLASPRDEPSLLRIINLPPRGIGKSSVARLVQTAVEQGRTVWDVLKDTPRVRDVAPSAMNAIQSFTELVEYHRSQVNRRSLVEITRNLIEQIGYRNELARVYSDAQEREARWVTVEEIVNAAGAYEGQTGSHVTLQGFLDDVALDGRDHDHDKKEKGMEKNAVVLMTLHSAKGLEFPQVYLVGMEEGVLPHHRSEEENGVDEERRLCYVGVTRAQDRLTLSMSQSRMKWGKSRETLPSRFLYELTGQPHHPNATGKTLKRPVRTAAAGRVRKSGRVQAHPKRRSTGD